MGERTCCPENTLLFFPEGGVELAVYLFALFAQGCGAGERVGVGAEEGGHMGEAQIPAPHPHPASTCLGRMEITNFPLNSCRNFGFLFPAISLNYLIPFAC